MVINIIGDCDKRPVLYTVMKICQTLGDVLLLTSSTRLVRLSDTRDTYGHYQNTMIAVTTEGVDDFFDEFNYTLQDFEYLIVDNISFADADVTIYVEGLIQSENEDDMLAYLDKYETIKLYKNNLFDAKTCRNMEEFESMRTMCPIGSKIAAAVAKVLAPYLGKDAKTIQDIAMQKNPAPDTSGLNRDVGKAKKGVNIKWH